MHTKSMKAWTKPHNVCSMNSETHTHICIYMHKHTCAHTHIQGHTHAHTYRDTHTHKHTCFYMHIHILTHMLSHADAHTHMYKHTHTCTNTHTHTHVQTHTHTHTCTNTHTHTCLPPLPPNAATPHSPPQHQTPPPHTHTHIPAKGTIGVDQSQRIKGGIHCLSRGKQVGHNRYAQVGNQQSQADIEHSSYVITCHTPQQQVHSGRQSTVPG